MKVGVIGAGFIGAIHLDAYANMPEVEVVGVADALPEIAAAGSAVGHELPHGVQVRGVEGGVVEELAE